MSLVLTREQEMYPPWSKFYSAYRKVNISTFPISLHLSKLYASARRLGHPQLQLEQYSFAPTTITTTK